MDSNSKLVFFYLSSLFTSVPLDFFLDGILGKTCREKKTATNIRLFKRSAIALVVGKHGYHLRPQVSRQMLGVRLKWVGWCCLFIVTLRHTYPLPHLSVHHLLKSFSPKTGNEKKFLSTQKLNSTSTTKRKTNKYTRRLRYTWRTLLEFKNTKKPEVQSIKE